ncbi:hypothetical protein FPV67DRAFT_1450193 [Lyophyllum atratum]|nr:hypothetical protein FPV67DRAFT_1450193 [Lyophyllum atratum]
MPLSVEESPPKLPYDIIHLIHSLDAENSTWAMVGRQFRRKAQQTAFANVTYRVVPHNPTDSHSPAVNNSLAQIIENNPAIGSYIRSITILCSQRIPNSRLAFPSFGKLDRVSSVELRFTEEIHPSPMSSLIKAVFLLVQRCGVQDLRVVGGVWAIPISWIAGLPSLRNLALSGISCDYSRNEDLERATLPVVPRPVRQQAMEEAVHQTTRQFILESGEEDYDSTFEYVLDITDRFSFAKWRDTDHCWPIAAAADLGVCQELHVDSKSIQSFLLLLYHSTSPRSAITFTRLRSLHIHGQAPGDIAAANLMSNLAQDTLQRIHWVFNKLQSVPRPVTAEAPPILVFPGNVTSVIFEYVNLHPYSLYIRHLISTIVPVLHKPLPPKITIALHITLTVSHFPQLVAHNTLVIQELAMELRQATRRFHLPEPLHLEWIPTRDSAPALIHEFEATMEAAWIEAWL